jgi:hypothetical protein
MSTASFVSPPAFSTPKASKRTFFSSTANQPASNLGHRSSGSTICARTNQHLTLKQNPLRLEHLQDFADCYHPQNRHDRTETDRFKPYTYEKLTQRDKANLDISWLKDESLEDYENLPPPETIAAEITENLEYALEQFSSIQEDLETQDIKG